MAKYIRITPSAQGAGAADTTVTVTSQPTLATTNGTTDTLSLNCNAHGLTAGMPIRLFLSTVGDANAAAQSLAGDYFVFVVTDANNFTIVPTASTSPTNSTGVFAVRRRIATPILFDPERICCISNVTNRVVEIKLTSSNTAIETYRVTLSSADTTYAAHEALAQLIMRGAADSFAYSGAYFDVDTVLGGRNIGVTIH